MRHLFGGNYITFVLLVTLTATVSGCTHEAKLDKARGKAWKGFARALHEVMYPANAALHRFHAATEEAFTAQTLGDVERYTTAMDSILASKTEQESAAAEIKTMVPPDVLASADQEQIRDLLRYTAHALDFRAAAIEHAWHGFSNLGAAEYHFAITASNLDQAARLQEEMDILIRAIGRRVSD